ncbi:PREDICTED: F-box protein At3g08750-like [Camelina sativa]|uniref:F-box protein At3g08750-like n=1 Tax=Camelina sativa TaxID=90675 RepID=A0ABM0XIC5_CAMSA|nr:PREDICTED: F-box protein At3g08750-like [Camelina sativa]
MASPKRLLLPSLPLEMIEEILYRTPAESLIRFKSTCKKWYALITSDKRFMYSHLDRSPERFIRVYDRQIMDPVSGTLSVALIPEEFRESYPIDSMVHCDGLLLCTCEKWNYRELKYAKLAVWNPVLRNMKWIEPSDIYRITDYFGFGYDNTVGSRDNYKILRLVVGPWRIRKDGYSDPDCEIYEFKSDTWRTLGRKFDWEVDFSKCNGVSVMGNMYWIAVKKEEHFIVSFDFSVETFKEICVCPSSWVTRLACFNGDRLSLLLQAEESTGIEVWMTNSLTDGVVSFSHYFNVTSPDLPPLHIHSEMARPGYSIGKHRNIMLWCEASVQEEEEDEDDKWYIRIKFYEFDQGGITKQIETARHRQYDYYDPFICSYVYVPSLIPIP